MNYRQLRPVIASIVLCLAGCGAIQPARMALPETLRADEPLLIEGMSAGQSGTFRVAAYAGQYRRSATRLELFGDVAVFDRGSASFTVQGLAAEPLTARCTVRQTTMTIGVVGFEPKKFAYECDFDQAGRPAAVRFSLQEGRDAGVPKTIQAERRGRAEAGAASLTVRSVHAVEGSPIPLAAPIGYVFEQNGRAVGAVELNGLTPRVWLPASSDDTRRAAVVATLALAVVWDPAQRP